MGIKKGIFDLVFFAKLDFNSTESEGNLFSLQPNSVSKLNFKTFSSISVFIFWHV